MDELKRVWRNAYAETRDPFDADATVWLRFPRKKEFVRQIRPGDAFFEIDPLGSVRVLNPAHLPHKNLSQQRIDYGQKEG